MNKENKMNRYMTEIQTLMNTGLSEDQAEALLNELMLLFG